METLHEWDSLVLQISKGEEKIGAIQIMHMDMNNMCYLHGMKREEVLEMLLAALETTPKDAVQ